jgi:lipid-A-disaccharide synthase
MVNLIAGRLVVPELLQDRFTPENVVAALRPLLADTPQREQMIADLAEVRRSLQPSPGTGSIQQVANAIDALLLENQPSSGPKSTASV